MSEWRDENGRLTPTGWANWAITGNDAVFEHQIPFVLAELHARIVQAVKQAIEEDRKSRYDTR